MQSKIHIKLGAIILPALIIMLSPLLTSAETFTSDERAKLEADLAQVLRDEANAESDLKIAQSKSSSLQNAINILAAKIKAEELDIKAKNLTIKKLGDNINSKQGEINQLEKRIATNKKDIAEIFRQIYSIEDTAIIEIISSDQTLSQFWDDNIRLETLINSVEVLSAELTANEASSTAEKNSLVTKQNAAMDARYAIQQEQKNVQANQAKQKQLLSINKENESAYLALVASKKKEADAINSKLFALAGGSNPIPFGQAYQYALAAEKRTGIDPAFLLAVLTQESNLGTNQGTCYLTNTATGAGVSVKSGKLFSNVMSPARDVPPFLQITKYLNVDPTRTVVSCPQAIGWGGAMGPAQFIASTWMLLNDRVTSAFGLSGIANPWNPEDAFMAAALYLTDLGAGSRGYTAESNAACHYYSGVSCNKSALIASYAKSVMNLASTIQSTEIDKLQGV